MRFAAGFQTYLYLTAVMLGVPMIAMGGPDVVSAHYHFAGASSLTADTNLAVLHNVLALPSAGAFKKLVSGRTSGWLASAFLGTNRSSASLIEPLLDDILKTESIGDFGGSLNKSLSFVMALRLESPRAELWRNNLRKALGGPGEKFTVEQNIGEHWNKNSSESFWMVAAQEWLLVGRGNDLLPVRDEYLKQISQHGRPVSVMQGNWLEADIDGSRLAAWPRSLKPARLKINLSTKAGNVQLDARAIYPEAMPWQPDPWQLPKELIRNPLISFSAAQNLAAFINQSSSFSRLDGSPLTNQFYAWALGQMPLQTYAAWPVAKAGNVLEKLAKEAPAAFNPDLTNFNHTELAWLPNYKKLVLSGLRVVVPSLQVATDHDRPFLLMTLFPLSPRNEPAPNPLWEQIRGRTNLVYYDWELTGPRLQQWRLLGHMLLDRPGARSEDMLDSTHTEDEWLGQMGVSLGNCVTEITRVSPQELSIVRNAPIGVTGVELFLFCDWLNSEGGGSPKP